MFNKVYLVKLCPRTGHEGPEEISRYNSTLSLTSELKVGVCGQIHTLAALSRGENPVPIV